jgi:hypothetical protein
VRSKCPAHPTLFVIKLPNSAAVWTQPRRRQEGCGFPFEVRLINTRPLKASAAHRSTRRQSVRPEQWAQRPGCTTAPALCTCACLARTVFAAFSLRFFLHAALTASHCNVEVLWHLRSSRRPNVKMTITRVSAPCSLVDVYRRLTVPYCLHHQGLNRIQNSSEKLSPSGRGVSTHTTLPGLETAFPIYDSSFYPHVAGVNT